MESPSQDGPGVRECESAPSPVTALTSPLCGGPSRGCSHLPRTVTTPPNQGSLLGQRLMAHTQGPLISSPGQVGSPLVPMPPASQVHGTVTILVLSQCRQRRWWGSDVRLPACASACGSELCTGDSGLQGHPGSGKQCTICTRDLSVYRGTSPVILGSKPPWPLGMEMGTSCRQRQKLSGL